MALDDLIVDAMKKDQQEQQYGYELRKAHLLEAFSHDFPRISALFPSPTVQPYSKSSMMPEILLPFDGQVWSLQVVILADDETDYEWDLSYPKRSTLDKFIPKDAEHRLLVEMGTYRTNNPPAKSY